MAYPTGINWQVRSSFVVAQPISETSSSQMHVLGQLVEAFDHTYGVGEFIYLPGVASTEAGSVVIYDQKAGSTTLTVAGSVGPAAVAMSANTAGRWGWYALAGSVPVKAGTVAGGTRAYTTSTAGQVDDIATLGAVISGMSLKAADSGGFATAQLNRPSIIASVDPEYTDVSSPAGNATANTRTGKAAIANGATSVTITNSLVTATSVINLTIVATGANHKRSATYNPTAGSFTMDINSAASGDLTFVWNIVKP